jgi:hypothetical protein
MIETAVWPAADARFPGHLREVPVKLIGRVGVAVHVTEDEVIVVPGVVGCPAFPGLPLPVGRERGDRALREFQGALGPGRLGVAALACRAPDVDHSLIEVYVIPREHAELAGAQAEGDRDDEQRLEPAVGFGAVVEAELRSARTACHVLEFDGHVGDGCVRVRLVSAR